MKTHTAEFRWSAGLPIFCLLILALVSADEQLIINFPTTLSAQWTNGQIPTSPALFGIPPSRGAVSGSLLLAPPGNVNACAPIDTSRIYNWPLDPLEPFIVILLVQRGDCSFVTKVRNAQTVKASAVVVMDNVYEDFMPIMADDGTGHDVDIPSVFIHRRDADAIISVINATMMHTNNYTGPVLATLSYNVPRADNLVEWTLFTSSWDVNAVDFKRSFAPVARALGNSAPIHPRYVVLNGTSIGCYSSTWQPCGKQCVNYGRYCLPDPEQDLSRGLDGEDVILENVRQYCVWKYLNSTTRSYVWWDYVNLFQQYCAINETTWTDNCGQQVMQSIGVPQSSVQECIQSAGSFSADAPNPTLDMMLNDIKNYGARLYPSIFINHDPYYGKLTCAQPINQQRCGLMQAICSGFRNETAVPACVSDCDLGVVKDVCGVCGGNGSTCTQPLPVQPAEQPASGGISVGVVFAIVVPIILVAIAVSVYCVRRMQKRNRLDLDRILQSYIPIDEANRMQSQGRGPAENRSLISISTDSAEPHTAQTSQAEVAMDDD